jgi:hypothetical protein
MNNWDFKSRHISFDGLRFGADRPSDVDGLLARPDCLVLFECKCGDVPIVGKQKEALEILVNNAEKAGQKGIAFVVRYYDRNPQNEVKIANCRVSDFYTNGKWTPMGYTRTLQEMMKMFLKA